MSYTISSVSVTSRVSIECCCYWLVNNCFQCPCHYQKMKIVNHTANRKWDDTVNCSSTPSSNGVYCSLMTDRRQSLCVVQNGSETRKRSRNTCNLSRVHCQFRLHFQSWEAQQNPAIKENSQIKIYFLFLSQKTKQE